MEARWILVHASGKAPFLGVFLCFVKFCVLLRKARQQLPGDGIKFLPPSPRSGGASSIVGGRVKVCLHWISRDSFGVCL